MQELNKLNNLKFIKFTPIIKPLFMHKTTLLLLVSLFYINSVMAQKPGFNAGIKLGANLNQIDGKYWENGMKTNLLGGAFASVDGLHFGVHIEGLFTQSTFVTGEGFNELYKDYYQAGKDSIMNGRFRVSSFSIPLLLDIRPIPKLKFQIGPQYSGILDINDQDNLLINASKLFKSGSIDGVVGVWIDLFAHFNIGARYIVGLSNISKVEGLTLNSQEVSDAWRQKLIQVHIGYNLF